MKNPLEYTLLEVEALLHDDADGPQFELTRLLRYVHDRQKELHEYQVQKVQEQIKHREILPRRKARSLDESLLDDCEIITLEAAK